MSPDDTTFAAAAANANWAKAPGYFLILANQPGDQSWPMTAATFILLYKKPDNAADVLEALKFFDWSYTKGGQMAADLDYVPMPAAVQKLVLESWTKIVDASGKPIWTKK